MLISQVKPDAKSILHFFDNHHSFYTKAYVYFTHKNEKLRASQVYSLQRKGHFYLDTIEVFYQNQWSVKKGDHHVYGMALSDHDTVDAFSKKSRQYTTTCQKPVRTAVSSCCIQIG
ncbi:hypothetical protein [Peribacillus acanthi]|uniref:hypothetical protein n=1 Tax=Peribacillus acanthi TaxID=2171554 RepID=UPI000D3E2F4F|nr:hypothetical protein [Peribacillus acanthi]